MKRYLSIGFLLLISSILSAQKVDWTRIKAANADRVLMDGPRQPSKVLVLGTFHFAYPNLDAHKTDSSNFVDVLSPTRQREMQELADVVMRMKPTRIYIESAKQAFHDSLYAEYRAGRYEPGRNEVYQLAYRIARLMGHEKLYCVDASSFANEYGHLIPGVDSLYNERAADPVRDAYWGKKFSRVYDMGDSLETTFTLLENFLLMAEPITQRRMHGAYLASGFSTVKNAGPDGLATWWYSRNLRIFNNILKTKPGKEDRLLLLFGNGHAPILRHCFESSPEFELIELKSLLR